MTTTKSNLDTNPNFKFGPPLIQTAEDAREAYLRGDISEKELDEAMGKFGHSDSTVWWTPSNLERPDDAFEHKLPEKYYDQPGVALLDREERIRVANEKEAVREAARKASEKISAEVKPETDLAEAKNEAAEKAAEKPQEKLDKTVADLSGGDKK